MYNSSKPYAWLLYSTYMYYIAYSTIVLSITRFHNIAAISCDAFCGPGLAHTSKLKPEQLMS